MGVTLGVLQNQEGWMGEGDDMIFVDDETKPVIIGTGSEDYFLRKLEFRRARRRDAVRAPLVRRAVDRTRRTHRRALLCYRWHGDNPVTFTRYLKHTMEHGHANHRADNFYSCCYWYQSEPYTDFPRAAPGGGPLPATRRGARSGRSENARRVKSTG